MARSPTRNGSGQNGEQSRPPCEDAGDDRHGPERPSWVVPGGVSGNGGFAAAHDDDTRKRFPTLFDFLTLTGWGGKARKTGTMLVFCEDGKWKACVTDRDGGHYAFHSSDTLEGLLKALDDALRGGALDWRVSKSWKR